MAHDKYWLNATWELLEHEMKEWLDDLFHFRWQDAGLHWHIVTLYISTLGGLIFELAVDKASGAYSDAKDFVDSVVGEIEEGAQTIVERITLIWGSITSIWAKFGLELLDRVDTVWDWVTGKVNHVYWWVEETYNDAKEWVAESADWVVEKADEFATWLENWADSIVDWIEKKATTVWDWISEKADNVWTWILTQGASIEEWLTRNAGYYSDLYDNYRDMLTSFLEDPETFILDRVVDGLEYVISWAVTLWW